MYVTSGAGIHHMQSNAQSDYLCNIQQNLPILHNTEHEKMDVAHGMTSQCYCASAHYKEDKKKHMDLDVLASSSVRVYSESENAETIKIHTEALPKQEKKLLSLKKQIEVAIRRNDHELLDKLSKSKVICENAISNWKNTIRHAELQIEWLNRKKMERKSCVIS